MIASLRILAEQAPRHLQWLRRDIILIFIADLPRGPVQLIPDVGILRVSPHLVWRFGVQELAIELAAAATFVRLRQAGVRETSKNEVRIARRLDSERAWLADRLSTTKGISNEETAASTS
ncbi:MAG: hypothetical protein ACREMF_05475 [Gemmatimonadales bacterium]